MTKEKAAPKHLIQIPRVQFDQISFKIVGDTPLICDRFPESAREEILDKNTKKAKGKRAAYSPEQSYESSIYRNGKDGHYFPATALKLAAISASSFMDTSVSKTEVRCLRVLGDLLAIEGKPHMEEHLVWRKGMHATRQVRHRATFDTWAIALTVRWDKDILSREQVIYLFDKAGANIGIGAFRPEKGRQNGCFHVEKGE